MHNLHRKITYYTVLLFTLCFTSIHVVAQDNYVLLPDASGFDRSGYEAELEGVVGTIITNLEEYDDLYNYNYASNFKVFDFGYYVHNQSMDESVAAKAAAISLADAQAENYFLLLKRTDENGVYSHVELFLKFDLPPNICYTTESLSSYLNSKLSSYNSDPNPLELDNKLSAFLNESIAIIEKLFLCCYDPVNLAEGKKKSSNTCTLCDQHFEDQILVFLKDHQYARYNTGFSNEPSISSVLITNEETGLTEDILLLGTTFQDELRNNFPDKDISFNVIQIDLATPTGCELGPGSFSSLQILESGMAQSSFRENVVIFKYLDGSIDVFYKFDFDPLINQAVCSGFIGDNFEKKKSVILPVIVARYIMKKAALAGLGVVIHIGSEIAIERFIGNSNTWGEAWDNVDLKGWQIFWAAIEGASGENIEALMATIGGCISGSMSYLTGADGCEFDLDHFLFETLDGCFTGFKNYLIIKLGFKLFSKAKSIFPSAKQSTLFRLLPKILRNKKVFKAYRLLGNDVDDDIIEKLGQDLKDSPALDNIIEQRVREWNRIRKAAKNANPNLPDAGKILRTDIPSLTALSKFDDALINSVGQQRFDNFLEKLIKANPKCSTCGNAGDALVGNLDNVLDDFHKVATVRAVAPNGGFIQGFDDFMAEAGEQASKAKAAALTLKKMSNNWDELTEGGYALTRFEGDIPDIETGHKLDLLFQRTNSNGITEIKSVEMKNWSSAQTVPSNQGTQYYAYLSSGSKFDYYFSDGIKEAMKARFQSIYKNSTKATELFNLNPTYFTSQNIPNATVLNNLANQDGLLTHPTFMNFIK